MYTIPSGICVRVCENAGLVKKKIKKRPQTKRRGENLEEFLMKDRKIRCMSLIFFLEDFGSGQFQFPRYPQYESTYNGRSNNSTSLSSFHKNR